MINLCSSALALQLSAAERRAPDCCLARARYVLQIKLLSACGLWKRKATCYWSRKQLCTTVCKQMRSASACRQASVAVAERSVGRVRASSGASHVFWFGSGWCQQNLRADTVGYGSGAAQSGNHPVRDIRFRRCNKQLQQVNDTPACVVIKVGARREAAPLAAPVALHPEVMLLRGLRHGATRLLALQLPCCCFCHCLCFMYTRELLPSCRRCMPRHNHC